MLQFSVVKDLRLYLDGSKKEFLKIMYLLDFFLIKGWSRKCVHLLFVVNYGKQRTVKLVLQLGFVAVVNLFCSPLLLFSASRPSFVLDGMSISITRNFDSTLESSILLMNPSNHQALDYVRLHLLTALCELIAVETNRYAFQKHVSDWTLTNEDEIWAFLGTVVGIPYTALI